MSKGEFLPKRKRGRRIKLDDLDDAKRESRLIYVGLVRGTISHEAGEIRGRALSRFREIIAEEGRERQLAALLAELQGLRGGATITFDPDLIE